MSRLNTKTELDFLTGTEIIDAFVDEDDWPVLRIKTLEGEELELEISRDSEGNGPGFIHGLPVVAAVMPS